MSLDDITVKTRPLINSKHSVHTTDNATDGATNHSTDRTCSPFTFAGSPLDASGHALGEHGRRNKQRRCNQRPHDSSFHRTSSFAKGTHDKPTADH